MQLQVLCFFIVVALIFIQVEAGRKNRKNGIEARNKKLKDKIEDPEYDALGNKKLKDKIEDPENDGLGNKKLKNGIEEPDNDGLGNKKLKNGIEELENDGLGQDKLKGGDLTRPGIEEENSPPNKSQNKYPGDDLVSRPGKVEEDDEDFETPKNKYRGEDEEENEQKYKKRPNNNDDENERDYKYPRYENGGSRDEGERKPPLNTNRGLDFEPMKPEVAKERGLKCVPGRTVIRMEQRQQTNHHDENEEDSRRTHMNWQEDKSKEDCKVCTCSIEGKDEYCSGRPARNLNECLVMARLSEELNTNMPFSHERELSNRIRRFGAEKRLGRPQCIPYVSEYTDCSDYTTCRGCNQCRCSSEGKWVCYKKKNTCSDDIIDMEVLVDASEDADVGSILQEMADDNRIKKSKKRPTHVAPLPEKRERATSSPVLGYLIAVLQ